jgi:hypothetical protein
MVLVILLINFPIRKRKEMEKMTLKIRKYKGEKQTNKKIKKIFCTKEDSSSSEEDEDEFSDSDT